MPCGKQALITCSLPYLGKAFLSHAGQEKAEHMHLPRGSHCSFLFIRPLQELRQYLSNLADQCASENNAADMPLVIILDNLHHVSSLGEIFNGLLNCKDHKW